MNKKKKKKILFDASVLKHGLESNCNRSGIYFVAYNLLKQFCKNQELEVTLFFKHNRYYYAYKQLRDKNVIPSNCKFKKKCAFFVDIIYACKQGNDNLLKKIGRFISARFFNLYDFYHTHIPPQGYDIYFSPVDYIPNCIQRCKSIKRYHLVHDLIPIILPDFCTNDSKKWGKKFLKETNNNTTYFTVSSNTKRDLIQHTNIKEENILVTLLGANENFYPIKDENTTLKIKQKYKIPIDKLYIFSFCTLEPRKNLIFALHNFINFIKQHNINNLVMVLGGAIRNDFKHIIENFMKEYSNYSDKIIITGYVADEDVKILYSNALCFVYPSLYEGFGMPILEAMQCGCPVICSNTSSMPEVIGNAGILINPKSDNDIIAAYTKYYFDNEFRTDCIQKGLKRAKTFSWEKCANIMLNKFLDN